MDAAGECAGNVGYVLDGYGGLHPYASAGAAMPTPHVTGYWSGWNIARSVAVAPGRGSGYVLDGLGGIHPWYVNGVPAATPSVTGTGYWAGWDIARRIVLNPADPSGESGYVLDAYGGMHSFSGPGTGLNQPIAINSGATGAHFGFKIARDVALTANGAGCLLDGGGGFIRLDSTADDLPVGHHLLPRVGHRPWPGGHQCADRRLCP